jgi:predicted nuclease of restriction endonuclease-like (RecB) superfamily
MMVGYEDLFADVVRVIEDARRAAARSVNIVMTATYWLVGRRIVEQEQGGRARAGYGEALLERLAADLTARFGRGFSLVNLETMRLFFQTYPDPGSGKPQTLSGESLAVNKPQTLSGALANVASRFRLSWSHYALLVRTRSPQAREFYETEALRGGWTVRQLRRQIDSQFYERTALSRNKAAMLRKGSMAKPEDAVTPEEEIKSPYVLEFLGLKDEYSESDLEAALISRLESFLLELGDDFTDGRRGTLDGLLAPHHGRSGASAPRGQLGQVPDSARQCHGERRALGLARAYGYRATVRLGDLTHDEQPQSYAAPAARLRAAHHRLEQAR